MERLIGHVIALAAAAAALFGGSEALAHHEPPVLGVTMLLIGGILGTLTYLSWQFYSRISWSYVCAIMSVMTLVTLFGAPKIRNMVHIPLGAAMIIPCVLIVGIVMMANARLDYRGTPSQKSQNAAR